MVVIIMIMLIIVVSAYSSKHLTKPLKMFVDYIGSARRNMKNLKIRNIKRSKEINLLNREFNHLINTIKEAEQRRDVFEKALKESEN